ncbi:fatty acid desaturase family protein [Brasilonema bromeliae]|nr:fatty acid desaturase family protein [Brasilonema bromeliae]
MKSKRFEQRILEHIRPMQKPDNWRNFVYLLRDYCLIALSIALYKIYPSIGTYLLTVLLIGSRMRAFDNLTHESSHKMLFTNPRLNYWIATLFCAFPVGTSTSTYWQSHMDHHKWLGNPERDPDLIRYQSLNVDRFPVPYREMVFHLLKVFCLTHVPKYLYGTLQSFVLSSDTPRSERIARTLFWITVFTVLTAFNLWHDFLLFWVIPFLTSFQILRYLSEISEHGGLYSAEHTIELARNNFCHPVLRFILYPHGDFYHLVHHLFPAIPHYNLGPAHQILLEDSEYQQAHHCYGYFYSSDPNQKSTLGEMILK